MTLTRAPLLRIEERRLRIQVIAVINLPVLELDVRKLLAPRRQVNIRPLQAHQVLLLPHPPQRVPHINGNLVLAQFHRPLGPLDGDHRYARRIASPPPGPASIEHHIRRKPRVPCVKAKILRRRIPAQIRLRLQVQVRQQPVPGNLVLPPHSPPGRRFAAGPAAAFPRSPPPSPP